MEVTPPSVPGETQKERQQRIAENRRLAMEIASKLETAERGNAVEAQLRKVLTDISARVNGEKANFARTEPFLRSWLERVSKQKAASTYEEYQRVVEEFLVILDSKGQAHLENVSVRDIQAYIDSMIRRGLAPSTIRVNMKILGAPFNLALRQGLILTNPVPAAELPKGGSEARLPFSKEEVSLLIEEARGTEWHTAILIGALTGLRLRDTCGLRWNNLDMVNGVIRIRPTKTKSRGSAADLILPLHPTLKDHLLTLEAPDEPDAPLMPELSKIKDASPLSRQFSRLMKRAGIDANQREGSGKRKHSDLSFHSLRHFFVSSLANAGVAADIRVTLSGHADERTHERYTHRQQALLIDAVNKLPSL